MELLWWCFTLLQVVSSAIASCENPVISSGNYSAVVFSQESLLLNCSATSYDQIQWFHLPNGKTKVEPYQFTWCKDDTCRLYDDPRMLNIRKVSTELSFSKFICVASCSATGKNASAYVLVIVEIQNVTVSLGETATLTCKAHMGTCYELSIPNFSWVGNGKNISELNTTNRYSTDVKLNDTGKLVTTLTIRDVTEEDPQSFDCILTDNHFEEGHVRKTIFLSLSEVNKAWDALVWHDDEHVQEASTLLAKLENIGYRVCTKEDQTSGQDLQGLEALIDSSACVIILRKDDGMMMTVLDKAQENKSVVLIQTKADPPPVSRVEKIMNIFKLRSQTKRYHPPQSNGEINKSMAGFLKLYWPSHDTSIFNFSKKLIRDEFYYRLRLKLPKQSLHVEAEHIQMQ
uniref:Soluble interferon alpha/beta receptor OPG204 n=2 Tax=Magallana gigas TaxID=29159 RepID=A0A8W8MSP5_MAGGI